MHRRRGQVDPFGNTTQAGDQLADLEPHQQTAVAGLSSLAVLDLDGGRIALHLGNGADDLVPTEVAGGDLEDDIFEEGTPQHPRRTAALSGSHDHRDTKNLIAVSHALE